VRVMLLLSAVSGGGGVADFCCVPTARVCLDASTDMRTCAFSQAHNQAPPRPPVRAARTHQSTTHHNAQRRQRMAGPSPPPRRIKFVRGLAEDTGFLDASFDCVVFSFVIHECPQVTLVAGCGQRARGVQLRASTRPAASATGMLPRGGGGGYCAECCPPRAPDCRPVRPPAAHNRRPSARSSRRRAASPSPAACCALSTTTRGALCCRLCARSCAVGAVELCLHAHLCVQHSPARTPALPTKHPDNTRTNAHTPRAAPRRSKTCRRSSSAS
jgi:hypothetical protein